MSKKEKLVSGLFFLILLVFFLVFFILDYPTVLFNTDDWILMTVNRGAYPIWGGHNPCRVLPETMMPVFCWIAAYIIKPVFGLGYVDAITYMSGIVLAAGVVFYTYCFFRILIARTGLPVFQCILLSLVFLIYHFLAYRKFTDEMHMFQPISLTHIYYYVVPNIINGIVLYIFIERDFFNNSFFTNNYRGLKAVYLLMIYLAVASNLYASIMLPAWIASSFAVRYFSRLKSKTKIDLRRFAKQNSLSIAVIVFWITVQVFELYGGRSKEISTSLPVIPQFILKLKELMISFYHELNHFFLFSAVIISALATGLMIKRRDRAAFVMLTKVILSAFVSLIYVALVSAKAASLITYPQIHFVPMVFAILLVVFCLFYIVKRFDWLYFVLPLFCFILLFETTTSKKAFNDSLPVPPALAKAVDEDIINQVLESIDEGEKIIEVKVPLYPGGDNWPLSEYGGSGVCGALTKHGIIPSGCYIEFVPDAEKNKEFGIN